VKVIDILNQSKITFSFEFFPPKTEPGWEKLFNSISELKDLKPSWVSVTYGAGGSTRENTHDLVIRIKNEIGLTVVSHLTCVNAGRDEIMRILERYHEAGVENILALKGDPPAGQIWDTPADGFRYASELITYIKKNYPKMCIGVAGYPEGHPATPNRLLEMDYLKAKVDSGADYIITQLFFDNRDFYDFRERCELIGIKVPVIAGIMPVLSRNSMVKISEKTDGARIPARLQKAVLRAENDRYAEKVGIHWATEQVRDLIDNRVQGIHFYTLNAARATLKIYEQLGVSCSTSFSD
jgi:methylenetetrahydrofolate reductase (NADPH)